MAGSSYIGPITAASSVYRRGRTGCCRGRSHEPANRASSAGSTSITSARPAHGVVVTSSRVEARGDEHVDLAEARQLEVALLQAGGAAMELRIPSEDALGPPRVDHRHADALRRLVEPGEVAQHAGTDQEPDRRRRPHQRFSKVMPAASASQVVGGDALVAQLALEHPADRAAGQLVAELDVARQREVRAAGRCTSGTAPPR